MNDAKLAELFAHLRECDWSKCDNVNPNVAFDSINDKLLSLYNVQKIPKKIKFFGDSPIKESLC